MYAASVKCKRKVLRHATGKSGERRGRQTRHDATRIFASFWRSGHDKLTLDDRTGAQVPVVQDDLGEVSVGKTLLQTSKDPSGRVSRQVFASRPHLAHRKLTLTEPYESTKTESGSATPMAYESWTRQRSARPAATSDLACEKGEHGEYTRCVLLELCWPSVQCNGCGRKEVKTQSESETRSRKAPELLSTYPV